MYFYINKKCTYIYIHIWRERERDHFLVFMYGQPEFRIGPPLGGPTKLCGGYLISLYYDMIGL